MTSSLSSEHLLRILSDVDECSAGIWSRSTVSTLIISFGVPKTNTKANLENYLVNIPYRCPKVI